MVSVSAVILAYGDDPWIETSVRAVLASTGVDLEVVLVDNGCTSSAVQRLAALPGVIVLRPGTNLGFAGGCNAGAARARGDVIALVNGDAIVEPAALSHLADVAMKPDVGIASASIRLADEPDVLNSRGSDLHFLGISWAGGFGEPADRHPSQKDVVGASGAGMAIRRQLWEELGGFEERYFAYHEDLELSLRCWQRGLRVVFVPEAVVYHHYDFTRSPEKLFWLERNRAIFVLTVLQARTLLVLAPALIATEVGMAALAAAQGWLPRKLQAWRWLLANAGWIGERRRQLQAERTIGDRELSSRFVSRLDARNYPLPAFTPVLNHLLVAYWWVARRLL